MRRSFLISFIALFFAQLSTAQDNKIGDWLEDANGLPCFKYIGKIPFAAYLQNGKKVNFLTIPGFYWGTTNLSSLRILAGSMK